MSFGRTNQETVQVQDIYVSHAYSQAKRMKRLKELLVPLKIEKKMFSPLLLSSPATPMERFGHERVGQL